MTNDQLQMLTESISNELFNKTFKHNAYFNPRLRTTGGRYMLSTHDIEINRKYYEEHGLEELEGIIKHELCHYHLHIEGKGYKHRDKDFRWLLKSVGAPRHCSPLTEVVEAKVRVLRIYECTNCNYIFERKRRVNTDRYVCGKCRGRIIEKV
ncbi:SprT family protein [Lederbergia lenta]|uniref:Protein SprT-like n=1 Tax=Lederbergia lenta TaxID=1467 RepID=A0A2X4VQL9_LEDLE|nr:SprT family protein [Lederbergia lenta]MCM3112272.1 SprT family protein [Lederbergia lenta]MEC2326492.1 SprT family protein [Lederbergia lenta]SQI53263.1 sprT-like protein [Lederbergia lenta]